MLSRGDLGLRLDPFYYDPETVEIERKVCEITSFKLRNLAKYVSSGSTPLTSESEKYYADEQNGIPFIRVQNLQETGEISFEDVKFINYATHNGLLNRSQVKEGDLLIKITGVGRMAVSSVAPNDFEGNINQHIVVVKTNSRHTSELIAAFLNTDIGEKLAFRRSTGGTRPALDFPALLSIPIILDDKILDLAKLARSQKEEKAVKSTKILSEIDDYLLDKLGITKATAETDMQSRMFYTNFCVTSGNRLDPKNYLTFYDRLKTNIEKGRYPSVYLRLLVTHSVSGDWGKDENEDGITDNKHYKKCLVLRATEFDNDYNFKLDGSRVKFRMIHETKLKNMNVQAGDLLIEKSGGSDNQPVGRIGIIEAEMLTQPLGFSNFVHKIRVNEGAIDREYLFCYLKTMHNIKLTDVMQSQTNGIRNLIMSEYLGQSIPLPPLSIQREIAQTISKMRAKAKFLQQSAVDLLAQTKQEIESMIIGEGV